MNGAFRTKLARFYDNLRHRKIIGTLVIYVVLCWLILQLCDWLLTRRELDNLYYMGLCALLIGLFPLIMLLAWYYNIGSKGLVPVVPFHDRRSLNNMQPCVERRLSNKNNKPQLPQGWYLYGQTGPLQGLEYQLEHSILIGRAIECELTLLRSYISLHHARITLKHNQLMIEDLASATGTLVNGQQITQPHPLQHDDSISFKDIIFNVREVSAAQSELAQPDAVSLIK